MPTRLVDDSFDPVSTYLYRVDRLKDEVKGHLARTGESKRQLSLRAGLQSNFLASFLSRQDWATTRHAHSILGAIDSYEAPE